MIKKKSSVLRQKYIEISSNRASKIKNLEQLIRNKEERITKTQVVLVDYIRDLGTTMDEYRLACIDTPGLAEIKGLEFDKLMQHPDIEDILIDSDFIHVMTGPIYIEYQDKEYDIGKFKITLSVNPRNFIVEMKNLTRSVPGRERRGTAHPHIWSDGRPCLGNIQECLPHMVGEYQFAAAISVCIQFLKSVNEDAGHFSDIRDWPLKATEKRENVEG